MLGRRAPGAPGEQSEHLPTTLVVRKGFSFFLRPLSTRSILVNSLFLGWGIELLGALEKGSGTIKGTSLPIPSLFAVDQIPQLGHEVPKRVEDHAEEGGCLLVGTGHEVAPLCSQGVSLCVRVLGIFLPDCVGNKRHMVGVGWGCQICSARDLC